MRFPLLLILALPFTARVQAATDPPGAQLYTKYCATCHDSGAARIPTAAALRQLPASLIAKTLESGVMRTQAAAMSPGERFLVSKWLGASGAASIAADKLPNRCAASVPLNPSAPAWTGWGASLSNLRFQTAAAAGVSAADLPRLKLKWAYGFEGGSMMKSQPAAYGGRVFAAGPDGTVVSLDAASGCVYWSTVVAAQVRTGISIGMVKGAPTAFFGDSTGQVYAIDAATGKPLWQIKADDHPAALVTGTPVYREGHLYVPVSSFEEVTGADPHYVCCTFRGSLLSLEAATGKVEWKTYTIADAPTPRKPNIHGVNSAGPSGAAVWSSPTLDPEHNMVYVTTGDNYSSPPSTTSDAVLAFSLDTGRFLWSRQMTEGDAYVVSCGQPGAANCPEHPGPDFDFGSSAILVQLAGGHRALILGQKSGMLHAVDPDHQGQVLWHTRVGNGSALGGIQWGPASDGSKVFVALSDVGFVPTAQLGSETKDMWGKPMPPFTFDPHHGGGLFAFRVDNGERLWNTPAPDCGKRLPCSPAQSQAVSAIPGAVFSGSLDAHLRAFSTTDGKMVWDFDTAQPFTTVNGVPAKGGSLDAGGAVIAGGMVFVGSGYAQFGGLPGNVLLAFSVDGR